MDTSLTSGSITSAFDDQRDVLPTEGKLTRQVETVTARIPSMGFLGLAVGSMMVSAGLQVFTRHKTWANFIGLWVPSFMLVGIYNKLVKLEGSDHRYNPRLH